MRYYSVILLKESKVEIIVNDDVKIFEESIILCELPDDFFDNNSKQDILKYFVGKIPPYKYKNAYGEKLSKEVVAVIDFFHVFENIKFENFTEIYSRHFIEPLTTTVTDIIKKYYFDFCILK